MGFCYAYSMTNTENQSQQYTVAYKVTAPKYSEAITTGQVHIIPGTNTFEDIRKILAIKRGCTVEQITITGMMLHP